jgi:allophanate hydrolase subunit 2
MVATVISSDLDTVGQCAPGTQTRFRAVSLDEALRARGERSARWAELREAVAPA